jgi:hypothetical protein
MPTLQATSKPRIIKQQLCEDCPYFPERNIGGVKKYCLRFAVPIKRTTWCIYYAHGPDRYYDRHVRLPGEYCGIFRDNHGKWVTPRGWCLDDFGNLRKDK